MNDENIVAERDFMEMLAEGKRLYMVESYEFMMNISEQYIKEELK